MSEVNKIVYGDDVLIDLTADTVTPDSMLDGVTAHAADGTIITGNVITHDVINSLDSDSAIDALAAAQGKILNKKLTNLDIQTAHETDLSLDTFEGGIGVEKIEGQTHKSSNLWDEQWEVGAIIRTSGSMQNYTDCIRSKNFNPCKGDTNYYLVCNSATTAAFVAYIFYDVDKNFIGGIWASNISIVSPSNAKYFKITTQNVSGNAYGGTYKNDIAVIEGTSGTYEPYGMWSAGDDYGVVDMGDLDFTKGTNDYFVVAKTSIPGIKSDADLICEGYEYVGTGSGSVKADMQMYNGTNNIGFRNDAYADPIAFKTAMRDKILTYELAKGAKVDEYALVVKENGSNIWDEQWELGKYNSSTGLKDTGTQIRCTNYIRCKGNTSYYMCSNISGTNNIAVLFYDENKSFIRLTGSNNISFVTPKNARYMTFYCSNSYGITYNHDIAIIEGVTGEYTPYISKTLVLPIGTTPLSSVGNIADEIVKEDGVWKRITRFGVVDLSTLTWSGSANRSGVEPANAYVTSGLNSVIKKITDDNVKSNSLSTNYVTTSRNIQYTGGYDKLSVNHTGNVYVNSSTTPSGMLIYELAEPIVEVLPNQEVLYSLESYADKTYITTADGLAKLGVNYGASDVAATALLAENNAELALIGNKDNANEISRIDSDFSIHTATGTSLSLRTGKGGMRWQDDAIFGQTHKSPNMWNLGDKTFTRYTGAIPFKFTSGNYTISAEVTSSDIDGAASIVIIGSKQLYFERNKRFSASFTLTEDAENITFYAGDSYSHSADDTATWKNIQIEAGSTATPYEPYGIHSAAEMYGCVDMGSLNYTYDNSSNHERFYAYPVGMKKGVNSVASNILCSAYETKSANDTFTHVKDKTISSDDVGRINIYDSAYTDPAALKASLAGVMLTYELADNATPSQYALVVEEVGKNQWANYEPTTVSRYANSTGKTLRQICPSIRAGVEYVLSVYGDGAKLIHLINSAKSIMANEPFTLTESQLDDSVNVYGISGVTTPLKIGPWQIEKGSVATTYTPYQGKTYPIPLPHPARGIGDVKEMVRKVRQKWVEDTKYGIAPMDSFAWSKNSTYGGFFVSVPIMKSSTLNIMCNKLTSLNSIFSWNQYENYDDMIIGTSGSYIFVKATSYADVDSFKAAMSGVMLIYELATPTTEPLPDQSAMYEMESYAEQTNISTADGLATMMVEYGTSDEIGLLLANDNKVNSIQEPDITVSTVDIGEGAALKSGAFYFVYE